MVNDPERADGLARRLASWPLARVLLSLGVLLIATVPRVGSAQSTGDYKLHAGDQIEVSVWNEEELKREIIVRPDGKFSFPLTGEVVAAGRTVNDIRSEIETRLKTYVSEPVVTVTVMDVKGNSVYVIGQVTKPGAFTMNPQLNVLQALSLAGGTTPFAKLDEIVVIRGNDSQQKTIRFNYGQVASGKDLKQNILLDAGDVVLVP